MICVVQLDEANMAQDNRPIQLPDYLDVEKEITDLPEFQPKALAARQAVPSVEEEKKQQSDGDER